MTGICQSTDNIDVNGLRCVDNSALCAREGLVRREVMVSEDGDASSDPNITQVCPFLVICFVVVHLPAEQH